MLSADRRQGRDSVSEYSVSCIDIVPAVTSVQHRGTGQGGCSGQVTRNLIHGRLSCRFAVHGDGPEDLPDVLPAGGRASARCEKANPGTIRASDAAGALCSGLVPLEP
jgi:hypothetical protein